MTDTDSRSICKYYRVCKDVSSITPVRTSTDKKIYLGLIRNADTLWLVYQFDTTDPSNWKYLIKLNSIRKAKVALHHLFKIHATGTYIHTFDILNTFKYIYGYKGKYQ